MMTKVAVLINDVEKQYEGLRSSLGMLLYNTEVQMFVIDQEIANMDEAYQDNMEFLIKTSTNGDQPKAVELYRYKKEMDWSCLVDDIFSHDKVICWW